MEHVGDESQASEQEPTLKHRSKKTYQDENCMILIVNI